MIDPTSDVGTVSEDEAPRCEVCGEAIVQRPGHRVRTWIDADQRVQHRHFCSEDCLSKWDADEP